MPGLACAAQSLVLPVHRAWVDARQVDDVSTDVSDAAMARAMGLNPVPRLANALPQRPAGSADGPVRAAAERVCMFPGGAQIKVFQAAPLPAGGANADLACSPLWRVVQLRSKPGRSVRLFTSEAAVPDAGQAGDVAMEVTKLVANSPIVGSADGVALPGVR
jgi:hypothetical protein